MAVHDAERDPGSESVCIHFFSTKVVAATACRSATSDRGTLKAGLFYRRRTTAIAAVVGTWSVA
jgi:hypothetical protein